jgi:AH receptor-interacting protein
MTEQMVLGVEAFDCGIQKSLIYAGTEPIQYLDGTKVFFHFKTLIKDDGTLLDDSKVYDEKKPMELVIGKKFKLEVWERAIKTMWLNEVARFTVIKDLLYDYPIAAKQLRDYYKRSNSKLFEEKQSQNHHHDHNHQHQSHHCCGFNLIEHGVGYSDLDKLLKSPCDLEFIFQIVRVELPGEYKKDSWLLNDKEQTDMIPILKQEGNELFKEKNYEQAARKYEEALNYLEQLMLKEKPKDVDWLKLNQQKLPILLNYSMCKYNLADYYSCIEHTNTILEYEPENVKALFRRAKANVAVWNLNEARQDLKKCSQIDSSVQSEVDNLLNYINRVESKKQKEERELFKGRLF